MAKKNKGGRPLKFRTPQKLQEAIDAYFLSCWEPKRDMFGNKLYDVDEKTGEKTLLMVQKTPYTITGLAVALDTSRETLLNYEEKGKFFDAVKRGKEKCQAYAENRLFGNGQASGAIFNLKNNYGWKDETKTDITSGGKPIQISGMEIK